MRTCWSSAWDKGPEITRATMSGIPPAAWGTMILTGREGHVCAAAAVANEAAASSRESMRHIGCGSRQI
jgi:hypothetical protein